MNALARWLPVNKPAAHTSHDVVAIARKRLNFRKIGHSGTLDPDVTGVVVLALGKATRLIQYLPGNKSYHAWIRLGITTDTRDASGKTLTEAQVPKLSREGLDKALDSFRGVIKQQPPMVSAVSYQGKRLHQLARQGIEVPDRPFREVEITELELASWNAPLLEVKVTCSSGTYIRAIAHDLGQALGCGGILDKMERTMANGCNLEQCVPLDSIRPLTETAEPGLAADQLLQHLPAITLVSDLALLHLYQGKILSVDAFTEPRQLQSNAFDSYLRVYSHKGEFVSIAQYQSAGIKSKLWLMGGEPSINS